MNGQPSYGTYLLLLDCDRPMALAVGKLGTLVTEPGCYLYVGSAFGPGGITARVRHHSRVSVRPHWHIDYLRTGAAYAGAWYRRGVRCEHEWAAALMASSLTAAPSRGFGASDCRCFAHLFHSRQRPEQHGLQAVLGCELHALIL